MTVLLDLARDVANGTANYSGFGDVPAALVLEITELGVDDDDTAVRIAHLVLQAMAAQRAVDLRLQDLRDNDSSDDYSDCA